MVYLLLAIVSSALISIIMRLSTGKIKGDLSMLAFNYLMCLALAAFHTGFDSLFPRVESLGFTIGLGTVNGALYLLGFVLLQLNVRKNGVVLPSTFMKLGLLVPMLVSICFFSEKPTMLQVLGFFIALASIVLINHSGDKSASGFKLGLILLLLAGGGCDAMSKIFEELGPAELAPQFLFYTFAVALIMCLSLVLFKGERPGKAEAFYGLIIGIPNFYCARFLLRSLESVPAVIAYPSYSVGTILVVTLAGIAFFKEKLSRRQLSAIAAILLALVLLNI